MSEIALKQLRKRKVVDTATAETIGRVRGVQIDPLGPQVVGIHVKGGTSGVVPYDRVIAVGADAVTVPDASVVQEAGDGLPRDSDAYGQRLLDETGQELGTVDDLGMDADGRITSVTAGGTTYRGTLLGIGSYAVVIGREPA